MGLRCSVLGHDYGETGVERERDERGAEVVRTAKRVQTCRHCGHERTVSANTEITALEPEAGVVRDGDGRVVAATAEENVAADGTGSITIEDGTLDGESPPEDATSSTGDTAVSLDEISGTDAETLSATEPASDTTATDNESDATATEHESDATATAPATERESDTATDTAATSSEGEIPTVKASQTDDPADEPGRAPGEWPGDPSAESAGSTGRTGNGTESLTPIGDTADSTAGNDSESETQPLSEEWTPEGAETRAKEGTTGTNGSPGTVEPGETFACRQCGFTAAVVDSPLRAGDSCPECRTGYLARGTRKG
ncbi:DUF7093 family protein [Halococcus saccharolyticus]|uniref:Uncharacterized protein n=1 Tax=Halococcus saccharolyticus DSM 5350 TaxID=1227455 RepID=M0MC38_9EURY|nr:hypothetical protein [Halococcus saccharolyticus]EMA43311.1 hypothetical protein C449_15072 [Halococcus saccharolyticus DSM 5350]